MLLPSSYLNVDIKDIEPRERISKTWKLDHKKNRVITQFIDGVEALAQDIWAMLTVEKKGYEIHTDNYGSRFPELYGRSTEVIKSRLESYVRETLTQDERITGISNFEVEFKELGRIAVIEFDFSCSEGVGRIAQEVEL